VWKVFKYGESKNTQGHVIWVVSETAVVKGMPRGSRCLEKVCISNNLYR
jgi:hypothetical protein